jgi:hypothetical protein
MCVVSSVDFSFTTSFVSVPAGRRRRRRRRRRWTALHFARFLVD